MSAGQLASRLPRWAVIRDARRRQRRRLLRRAIVLIALAVLTVGLLTQDGAPGSRAATGHGVSTEIGGLIEAAHASGGHIWVLTCDSGCERIFNGLDREQLVEVDASTGFVVRRLPMLDANAMTTSGHSVWVAHFDSGVITRVDTTSGRTTAMVKLRLPVPLEHHDRQFLPSSLSASGGFVWVSTARGWIAQIDERAGALARMVRSPSQANITTTDRYGTWAAEELGGVGVLRPHTSRIRVRPMMWHGLPLDIGEVFSSPAAVWATAIRFGIGGPSRTIVLILNPRTERVVRRVQVPPATDGVVSDGALYVGDLGHGRVYRVRSDGGVSSFRTARVNAWLSTVSPGFLWAATSVERAPSRPGRLLRIRLPPA